MLSLLGDDRTSQMKMDGRHSGNHTVEGVNMGINMMVRG